MIYKYILAVDPSGSYNEGKGTTGWCLLGAQTKNIIKFGSINAKDYPTQQHYWDAHLSLINELPEQCAGSVKVVLEDYLLYANKAVQQTNSRMETSQLLGILKHHVQSKDLPCLIQTASEVKSRWADRILLHKGIIKQKGNIYIHPITKEILNRHVRDAVRHAVHVAMFKNKGER